MNIYDSHYPGIHCDPRTFGGQLVEQQLMEQLQQDGGEDKRFEIKFMIN